MDNFRLCRVCALMEQVGVDALLVHDFVNVSYLASRPSADAWLLITFKKAWYITDFRYFDECSLFFKDHDLQVVQFQNSMLQTIVSLAKKARVQKMGISPHMMTVDIYQKLKFLCQKNISLKNLLFPIESLRMIKDDMEIKTIQEAIKINLEVFDWIHKKIQPGVRESDLLKQIQRLIEKKSVSFSFDPIIASGVHSSYPHARVTEKKLIAGEPLLIDLGIEKDGYKSDLTRMFFLGKMPSSFKKELNIVLDAQREAIQFIKEGALVKDIDKKARKYLKKYKMDQYFGHSLGHGVGLDIHEMPRISSQSGAVLLENMIITIEPGVYFSNKYGIRWEDMVLVTKTGCQVLSDRK